MTSLPQYVRALGLAIVILVVACGGQQDIPESEPETTLREVVVEYNRMLKWGQYDRAAEFVADNFREAFIGRYEERGDDFKIVSLELMTVKYEGPVAVIETEQEWYDESMVVKKGRFIELWSRYGGDWFRNERMTKKEFRKRKKELFPSAKVDKSAVKKDPSSESKADTEPTNPPKPEPVEP